MDNKRHSTVPMSERDFQASVLDLARWAGWRVFHTYNSRRSEPGYPDLCMVRRDVCLMIELKTDTGRVTAAQEGWLNALDAVPGIEAAIWRPRDWSVVQEKLTTQDQESILSSSPKCQRPDSLTTRSGLWTLDATS